MKFKDTYFNKEKRYSIGIEEETGKYYLSFPVSNPYVDYEEYYEISSELYNGHPETIPDIEHLLEECRSQERDDLLLQKPGKYRGTAT